MAFIIVDRNENGIVQKINMLMPSDFHNHFRLAALRRAVTPVVSWPYKYMLAMPNTDPPIKTAKEALCSKNEIEEILYEAGINHCQIIPTIYLCAETTPATIYAFAEVGLRVIVKSYPPHPQGTTNSHHAVPLLSKGDVLWAIAECKGKLLSHGECVLDTQGEVIPFQDREKYYMLNIFPELRSTYSTLQICQEHICTQTAVDAVKSDDSGMTVCTITPQHALLNDRAFTQPWGGVHARCMPYLQTEKNRLAVAEFMTSGDKRAILGTDCAPHLRRSKEKPFEEAMCGCYTPHALAMYAKVFDDMGRLDDRFVQFASLNGPKWWGLPAPTVNERITLINDPAHSIPSPTAVPEENDIVVPLGWTEDFTQRMALEFALVHPQH